MWCDRDSVFLEKSRNLQTSSCQAWRPAASFSWMPLESLDTWNESTLEPDSHQATLPVNFWHAKNGDPSQGRHWSWGFRGPSPNPQVTITYFSNKLVMHLKTNWRYASLKLSSNFCEARTSKRKYFIGGTRFLWMHSLIRQQMTQKFTLGVT